MDDQSSSGRPVPATLMDYGFDRAHIGVLPHRAACGGPACAPGVQVAASPGAADSQMAGGARRCAGAPLRRAGTRGVAPCLFPRAQPRRRSTSTRSATSLPSAKLRNQRAAACSSPRTLTLSFPAETPIDPKIRGTRLEAPGACDNGAGVVCLLAIAAALAHAEIDHECDVVFVG